MRLHLTALLTFLSAATAVHANEPQQLPAPPPLPPLIRPTTTAECLETMELVVKQTEDADLLDDQSEEVETLLEKMDDACHAQRFDDALGAGREIHRILATNK